MFTGIIQETAPILGVVHKGENIRVRIKKPKKWNIALGQSVAVDGICSTVTATSKISFTVSYMPETLRKTTAGTFKKGGVLNLERSLTLQSFVDGHLVQGHVDERAEVYNVTRDKKGYTVTPSISRALARYVAERGSIALNGVSLTVAQKKGNVFTVALIPYTLETTNLGNLKKGDYVNIEVDMMARYILNI